MIGYVFDIEVVDYRDRIIDFIDVFQTRELAEAVAKKEEIPHFRVLQCDIQPVKEGRYNGWAWADVPLKFPGHDLKYPEGFWHFRIHRTKNAILEGADQAQKVYLKADWTS